jgi:hypothetical protein
MRFTREIVGILLVMLHYCFSQSENHAILSLKRSTSSNWRNLQLVEDDLLYSRSKHLTKEKCWILHKSSYNNLPSMVITLQIFQALKNIYCTLEGFMWRRLGQKVTKWYVLALIYPFSNVYNGCRVRYRMV